MSPTILTRSGRYFDFSDPEKSHIDIDTIAHALANLCRFTGHTSSFYSAAQHSVLVSHIVPTEHALAGLLHDATEAYLGDVASPLKALLPDYKALEHRVEAAVLGHFGLSAELPHCVKWADMVALATESRDLMPPHEPWECLISIPPSALQIIPVEPYIARRLFLARFHELVSSSERRHARRGPAIPENCGSGHCSCIEYLKVDWSAA